MPASSRTARVLSKTHLPALDGVRGVAILVVLVHNLSIIEARATTIEKLWTAIVEAGWIGVQLFFVLSGFLITGILVDDRERPGRLRTFYLRRVVRIFPLYYAFLFLYFVVLPPLFPGLKRPISEVVWYWLFLSNWSTLAYGLLPGMGHVWSLAVEEQFYLVWPWLAGRLRSGTFAVACVAIALVSLVARVVLHHLGASDLWLYSSTLTRVDALALGALVALAVRSEIWRTRLERALRPLGIGVGVALVLLAAATHGVNRNNPWMQIYGYSLLAVGFALFVFRAASSSPPRWLAHPVLQFFGKYSYGIYVIHPPLKVAVWTWQKAWLDARSETHPVTVDVGFELVVGLASIALALGTWRAIERPFLRAKDRLAPRAE
ncbi:MAG: acyltransferase [Deltaproteobacteria bacterium]|nr:acyltransferase [Deltaproteobacteria bacterium]